MEMIGIKVIGYICLKFKYCCPIKLEDVKKAWLER